MVCSYMVLIILAKCHTINTACTVLGTTLLEYRQIDLLTNHLANNNKHTGILLYQDTQLTTVMLVSDI